MNSQPFFKKRFSSGQTLLESIIAIGVIMTGVVGSLVLINTTINLGRANEDRIVAQNLAREGLELAYDLRNSAALVNTEQPYVTWDSYLFSIISKVGFYDPLYDVGTGDPNDRTTCRGSTQLEGQDGRSDLCDLLAVINWIFEVGGVQDMPYYCDQPSPSDPSSLYHCDYNKDGHTNLGDVIFQIKHIYKDSYILSAGGYPTFVTDTTGLASSVTPIQTLTFNSTAIDLSNPTIPKPNFTQIWNDTRSRIYLFNNNYTQNAVPTTTSGIQPTKFYRVVSLQSVCQAQDKSTNPPTVKNFLEDTDTIENCSDYIKRTQSASGWEYVAKVGVLVNSEVRWPTPLSPTKVVYQEYLYDWISF